MTPTEIIDLLGGYREIAHELGVNGSAVHSWKKAGIPAGRCLELAAIAKRRRVRSITLEILLAAQSAKPPAQVDQPKASPKAKVRSLPLNVKRSLIPTRRKGKKVNG